MEKAYKFRLYPNKEQQILLAKTFGCNRFIYNYYLEKRITAYKTDKTTLSAYDCIRDLTSLKNLARNPTGFRRWDEWLGVMHG